MDSLPPDAWGELVRQGRAIFIDTPRQAARYVGNGLRCSNCHLDEGRKADAAPMWGAWPRYPQYRLKNGRVLTFEERVQDCFRYSLNGFAPPLDAPELRALTAYAQWLSTGVPVNADPPGRSFPFIEIRQDPSPERGAASYAQKCAVCHGRNGEGQRAGGGYGVPPLWGRDSYNQGAGMHQLDMAARFIKANMPLGTANLSGQEAYDIAAFLRLQYRPPSPREGALRRLLGR